MEVTAEAERSSLTQDDNDCRAGTLGFALPETLREGPVRVQFAYGTTGYRRIRLGLLE